MAAGKTIKTSIQIDADIKSFEQGLSSIETKLAQLKMPAGLSRAFAQEISTIKDQLSKLSDYTTNNELSIVDAKKAQKSLDIIQQQYSKLIATLKDERMGEVVSKDDAKRLEALVSAMETYNTKMAAAVKQEEQLIKQVNRATAAQEAFNKKKEQQKVIDDASYDVMKKQLADRQKEEKKLVEAAAAATAAKEKRKADSGGKYTSDDSVGFKQTKEYKEWKAITDQLNKSKEITLQLERQLAGVTTASAQAQEEKKVTDAVTDANAALDTFRSTALQTAKTEAMSAVREELKDVEGLTPEAIQSIDDLKQTIEDQAQAAANNGAALRQMDGELDTCGQAAKDMGEKVETSTEDLNKQNQAASNVKGFVERIKQFTGLAGAMMIIRRVAQGAFNAIKELDAQMTEMAVVTSQGVGDYWKQMPEHTKRANELGVAIKDVYEAETLYYQQGLKANEVTEMSNSTLRMARIAGLGAAEATDKMTAALRGFNMELNGASADRVADVYSKLAAITASNVDEISTAMTKTASIASNAGMQFETTAAFLSQIIETTRESAETAGTALKTVIARFQELKKDPSEIGEVDGEVVDANKIETALRSVGVELRDVSGQFRDLDTVFMELAGKWDSLDTNTQRYIATIAAGSRQQSRFIAMMSDYSRTTELVDAANNAAGASNEQFEKTLDSLETCLNRLSNAWTEFTTGLMNSEFVKFIIDALTGILNALNSLTSSSNNTVNSMLKLGLIVGIVFAAKAAVDAFTASYETSGTVIGGISGVASGFIDGVKNKVLGLGQALGVTFSKDYALKVQSQQVELAKQRSEQLTKTNTRLAQIEKELAQIEKDKNSKKGASNSQLSKENFLLQEQNKLKKDQQVLEGQLVGSKTLLAIADSKELLAKAANINAVEAELVAKGAGIPVDNARILLAKGYTEEEIKQMGATEANTLATNLKTNAEKLANLSGIRLWLTTKMSTLAQKLETKGKIGGALAAKMKAVADAAATGSTMALAGAVWSLLWPLLLVAAAIAAVVVVVYLLIKAFKKAKANTPEERLKRDKKALEEMNEAANKAAESYQKLSESIDKIKDGYKNLDTLTVGTKEWKDAVEDVNSQVMDLIDKYPELASQVENVNGVMKLSDEALDSIAQREKAIADTKKIDAINQSVKVANTAAEVEEKQAKQELTSQLAKRGILTYNNGGMGEAANNQKKVNEATDQAKVVAEALASGKLSGKATASQIKEYLASQNITISDDMAKSFEESRDQLKEWGKSLEQVTNANLIAAQKLSKIALDQTDLSEEQKANMSDAATEISLQMQEQNEKYAKSIGEGYDGLSKDQKKERTKDMYEHYGNGDAEKGKEKYLQWARETFGQEVSVDEFGNVLDGKGEKIGSNVDTMQRFAKAQSVTDTARIAEKYQAHLDKMGAQSEQAGSAVKKFGNKKSMTGADLAALSAEDAQAELDKLNLKANLTEDDLILQTYYKELVAAQDMRNKNLEAFQDKLKENYHIDSSTLKQMTDMATNVSSEMLTGFTNALANNNIKDSAAVQNLWDQFAQVINTDGLSSEQREDIARQFNSLDMTDKYAIEAFKEEMEKTYKGMDIDWTSLTNSMTIAGKALHKISTEELPKFATNMNKIISELNAGARKANFTQEEWEQMSKSLDSNLKKQFVRMNDGTYQFIGGVNQLANALKKNTQDLINEQIEVIDADRQKAIDAKRKTALKAETKEKGLSDEQIKEIQDIYDNADLSTKSGQEAFRKAITEKGYSDKVNTDNLISKGTLSRTEEQGYLEQKKDVYNIAGQSMSPSQLNELISNTVKKIGTEQTDAERELTQAQLTGYSNAKQALASYAGVDQSLITEFQNAQTDYETAQSDAAEKNRIAEEKAAYAAEKKDELDSLEQWQFISKGIVGIEYAVADYSSGQASRAAEAAEKARNEAFERQQKAAQALDDALFQASSSFSDVNIATNNLKTSQEALANSQKKYKDLLSDSSKSASDLADNLNAQKEQLNSILGENGLAASVIKAQEESIQAQKKAIESQYAEFGEGLLVFNEERQRYEINTEKGRELWDKGKEDALVKAVEELNKKQEEKVKTQEEQDQARKDLKALEETSRNAMATALDKIVPILEKNRQEQIDSLTTLNESITNVQSSILDGMRESIDLERQIRDNTQKEQDIQDKEARLAYLMADSSGANANEIASLQKEIKDARQDQTDTLIDQALDQIESENEKAAEQRQQQIDLMKEQLELDKQRDLRAQAFELLKNGSLDNWESFEKSDFVDKVKQTDEYKGLSKIEQDAYLEDLFNKLKEGVAGALNLGVAHYATGGLVESTGPAWLDGTPSNPELVLNSQDARNFLMLKDVLSELVGAHTSNYNETDNKNSSTSYVDIDINVDSLSSDYDVDNIANRIQEYLAENALYRNTTMVSNRR